LLVGLTVGFIIGVSSAVSSIDSTIQAIQEECDDKHAVHKSEHTKLLPL
jgi:hypothetical protein